MLSLSVSLSTKSRALKGGFTPASLFASGEQGAWYDPSDLTTLYQDSAGTTPVTADGDPVGYMGDKSGNGNHATQSTSAARPVYRTDGTLHWLEFDGVDDYLMVQESGTLSSVSPVTMSSGFSLQSGDDNNRFIMDIETGRLVFGSRAGSFQESGVYDGAWRSTPTSLNTPYVITALVKSDASLRINGIEEVTFASSEFQASAEIVIGARYTRDRSFHDGPLYGLVFRAADTSADDLSRMEGYLANKSGVTL